jgi:hypothetical protein
LTIDIDRIIFCCSSSGSNTLRSEFFKSIFIASSIASLQNFFLNSSDDISFLSFTSFVKIQKIVDRTNSVLPALMFYTKRFLISKPISSWSNSFKGTLYKASTTTSRTSSLGIFRHSKNLFSRCFEFSCLQAYS